MFWRNGLGQNPGRWHGPVTVINHENDSVVWLSHIGRIYRTAPEHIRSLSIREDQESQETQTTDSSKMPSQIGKGVFQYEDLTSQLQSPSLSNIEPVNIPTIPPPETSETVEVPTETNHDKPRELPYQLPRRL